MENIPNNKNRRMKFRYRDWRGIFQNMLHIKIIRFENIEIILYWKKYSQFPLAWSGFVSKTFSSKFLHFSIHALGFLSGLLLFKNLLNSFSEIKKFPLTKNSYFVKIVNILSNSLQIYQNILSLDLIFANHFIYWFYFFYSLNLQVINKEIQNIIWQFSQSLQQWIHTPIIYSGSQLRSTLRKTKLTISVYKDL